MSEKSERIRKLIGNARFDTAITELDNLVKGNNEFEDEVLSIKTLLSSAKRAYRRGEMTNDEKQRKDMQATNRLLELLGEIEDEISVPSDGKTSLESETTPVASGKKVVFISYSRKNRDVMMRLKSEFEREDIDVIMDETHLKMSENISTQLKQFVRDADFTVSVVSKTSIESSWVGLEAAENLMLEEALQSPKILFVVIETAVMDADFQFNTHDKIQLEIDKNEKNRNRAKERNMDTSRFDNQIVRLEKQQDYLGKMMNKLQEDLWLDFSSEQGIQENLPKLIQTIKAE